ncbi:ESYT1 protein, partial [Podargus strigoides]|nr:ESYT1 protein [Podargus strigoides]
DPLASTSSTHRPTHASPDPQFGTEHVLRIHLLEAENLIAKDNFFKGVVRGRSDPYAKVRVAGRGFRSRVVKEDLNPRWNEVYEVIVDDVPGQDVEFDLYDKDIDKDDFLGRWVLGGDMGGAWLPLEEVKSGRLHVRLESLAPCPSAALLEQVLHTNTLLQPARGEELTAALLSVFVDRATDLPLRKGSKPPAAFATLAVRDVSVKTKVRHGGGVGGGPGGGVANPGHGGGPGVSPPRSPWLSPPHAGGPAMSPTMLGAPGVGALTPSCPPRRLEAAEAPLGWLQLTLWYHGDERKLVAIVHGCRKLRVVAKELPDPYVSLALLPDRNRGSKRRTSAQRRSLNPDFNERFEWVISLEEALQRKLEVQVKSSPSFMSREKEVLGKLHLDLVQVDLSEGGTHW